MPEDKKEIFPQEFQTLIAGIFPNTKFFETKFENLQMQIDMLRRTQEDFKEEMRDLRQDMNYRFMQVDKRFSEMKEDIDKRFEQVDKRFEQVDKRFEQIIASIDRLSDKLDKRDVEQRNFTLKMFSISIAISVLGVLGAMLKIIGVF